MEVLQTPLLVALLTAYLLGFAFYFLTYIYSKGSLKNSARLLTLLAFILNSGLLVIRGILISGLPLRNLFEFGLFFVWAITLIFLIIEYKFDLSVSALFVLPVVIGLLLFLVNLDITIRPAMPALRSKWLIIHVLTAVLAYGAFAMSFALSIMYLVKDNLVSKNPQDKLVKILPKLELLDELSYKVIFIGMPALTIMLVTGAVWAEYSWGRYWSWDPKETWALITWFIYSAYLHVRLRGWKGKKAAIISIVGFIAVIFTFLGVSYLLPGIHSYV
ncbi:MAG: c-type cytochrome biogenesis protein CcsB [Peptococcales bacterium]|jgi:cytochrome c-type biogenesis protein CcsB